MNLIEPVTTNVCASPLFPSPSMGKFIEFVYNMRFCGGRTSHVCYAMILDVTRTQIKTINEHGNRATVRLADGKIFGGNGDMFARQILTLEGRKLAEQAFINHLNPNIKPHST